MQITLLITILFWNSPPMEVAVLTSESKCTQESMQAYTHRFRELNDWKAIKAECAENGEIDSKFMIVDWSRTD